jgi:flagellar motor component MotA
MQILALLLGVGVTGAGLFLSTSDVGMFLDGTSLFIVIGGTLASTAISVQIPRIVKLFKIFINKMIKGRAVNYQEVIKQIIRLSDAFYSNKNLQEFKESMLKMTDI